MKITKENYFREVEKIGAGKLPEVLQESHKLIKEKTRSGKDWSEYEKDQTLHRIFDLSFFKLEEYLDLEKKGLSGTGKPETRKPARKKNSYSGIRREVHFIGRFLEFNDKVLYKKTFEVFIDELQEAIRKKEITKKSPVAKDILNIQNAVVSAFNSMKNARHFVLRPSTVKRLRGIIEKYEDAYEDLDKKYIKAKKKKVGLDGIEKPNEKVMCSTDFNEMKFSTIGLKDKWLEFIGDPCKGFTAMVYGKPKMGKSYLCIEFAGYLARNHGKVLYVAREEKLDATLQQKLKNKDVAHPNLFVSDDLPKDLTGYDYVFIDSVNKMGLSPKQLEALSVENPDISFIYVFQTTKEGNFRGTNEFQHDVDVVINLPEKGKAIQYGRFNQGGEMNIFNSELPKV